MFDGSRPYKTACDHTNQCPSGWQCDTGPNIVAKNDQNDLPRKSCDDGTYYLKKAYQPACYCHLINDTQVKGLAVPAATWLADKDKPYLKNK